MPTRKRIAVATATCLALLGSSFALISNATNANAAGSSPDSGSNKTETVGKISQSCTGTIMKDSKGKPLSIKYGDTIKNGKDEAIGRLDIWVDDKAGTICARNWRINDAEKVNGYTSVALQVKGKPESGNTYAKDSNEYTLYAGASTVTASDIEVTITAKLEYKDTKKTDAKLQSASPKSVTVKAPKKSSTTKPPTPGKEESKKQVKTQLAMMQNTFQKNWVALAECVSDFDNTKTTKTSKGVHYGVFQISEENWKKVGGKGKPNDASTNNQLSQAMTLFTQTALVQKSEAKAVDLLWGEIKDAQGKKCGPKLLAVPTVTKK